MMAHLLPYRKRMSSTPPTNDTRLIWIDLEMTGLWDKVLASETSLAQAEAVTVDFLARWVPAGKSPICGNSICQDRRFLVRLMPRLERYFHYRNLDVSTLKELSRRWSPDLVNGFAKAGSHTAMADIRESVNELAYYRQFMGKLGGQAS